MLWEGSSLEFSCSDKAHPLAEMAEKIGARSLLDSSSLKDVLDTHYCFPSDNRTILWRFLLHLPMNEDQYVILATQEMHPVAKNLSQTLPIKYSTVASHLSRILSCLYYFHPPLAECDWLPSLVFPFLKIFQRDSLITFEIIVTIIINWCVEWVNFIPNPPITVLSRIESIAKKHKAKAPLSVAWPALRSFFAEVATTECVLILMDNIIARNPAFIEYLVVSFSMIKGEKIISISNVYDVIKRARNMFNEDRKGFENGVCFIAIKRGVYPVIPIVKKSPLWRERELNRIREESEAADKKNILRTEIENESKKIERQRRNWMAERSVLREIEEEQMAEFRRRETEIILRESQEEDINLQIQRETLRKRRIEEEKTIDEWRNDSYRVQEDMRKVSEIRKATWAKWLRIKEESSIQNNDELETDIQMIKERDLIIKEHIQRHNDFITKQSIEEQEMIRQASQRNQELQEKTRLLKEQLDEARKAQRGRLFPKNLN